MKSVLKPGEVTSKLLEHLSKLGKRQASFIIMLEHILKTDEPMIIETGCMREANNYEGDGMSTMFWDILCDIKPGAWYHSIDISVANVGFARSQVTRPECIIQHDSVKYLSVNRPKKIDLLYLDSYDLDPSNPQPSFLHCLNEFMTCLPLLSGDALICVDDNILAQDQDGNDIRISKGQYIRQYMDVIGNKPIYDEYQILWQWKKSMDWSNL